MLINLNNYTRYGIIIKWFEIVFVLNGFFENDLVKTCSIPERHCDVVALDNRSNLGFVYRVYLGCFVPRSDVSS